MAAKQDHNIFNLVNYYGTLWHFVCVEHILLLLISPISLSCHSPVIIACGFFCWPA
jgi:hypothetical protein